MSDYTVVVNATPVILLHGIDQLELLRLLYAKIYIPEAVYAEVITDCDEKINGHDFIKDNDWIEVVRIHNTGAKKLFTTSLHAGEVETMILAMQTTADLCILDDLLARKHAKYIGLSITGTLGVLVAAKNRGLIKEVKPLVDRLIEAGMFVDKDLYSSVLISAEEE